jgi:glycosyltransferase involved in cell wall biosynthesis
MKIAVNGYIGPKKTGIGVVTEEFLSRLALNNLEAHEYFVFCNYDTELSLPADGNLHIIYYKVSRNSALKNLLWMIFIYPLECWKVQAQISIIPNVTTLVFKVCPTIVIIHDLIEFKVPGKFDWLRMLYRRIAVPVTAYRADSIVTDSASSYNDIIAEFGVRLSSKLRVIYPGMRAIKSLTSKSDDVQSVKIPGEYLLYVGTVDHPGKNGIALAKIFSQLPQHLQRKMYVVYAGKPGPGYEYITREIESLGIKDRVIFLGYVPEASLPDLYANCKVFIFPSHYEGFGLPVIEAMHYGSPVITAANSSLIESAGDAGLLFDADDIEGMAKAVEHICKDDDYRMNLVSKGREHIKKFSWDENCCQWKELINSWDKSKNNDFEKHRDNLKE